MLPKSRPGRRSYPAQIVGARGFLTPLGQNATEDRLHIVGGASEAPGFSFTLVALCCWAEARPPPLGRRISENGIMANEGYHEPINELSDETRDMHRAITSLMEELEAVDWYNQRVDACKDAELKAILEHNRDEEKEHAAMVLEWIRRRDPKMNEELRDYLFTDKQIAHK